MIVASFWVRRPEEHPEAAARNYPGMLQVLQRSCDRLGLSHICLTDYTTFGRYWPEGVKGWSHGQLLPVPLMQALTEVQAKFLETNPEEDVMFVGADCIMLRDPESFYPKEPALCITYRSTLDKHPINNGAQLVRKHSMEKVMPLFRRIADRCGTVWCDDQRALCAELAPLPEKHGVYERAGMSVAFMPMAKRNVVPRSIADPCANACMVHFRGKNRKKYFFDWARYQRV